VLKLKYLLLAGAAMTLVGGCNGCRSKHKANQVSSAAQKNRRGLRRNPIGERRKPRVGPIWRSGPEEYYGTSDGDHAVEHDGAPAITPVPRPDPGALPAARSFSVGPPNGGWLMGGRAMDLKSPSYRVLPSTAARNWNYGGEELVALLKRSAHAVAEQYPGAVLRVGNMSRKSGGKIAPSQSHQSGRDVDLGLYCTNLDNVPVDPPGFPRFKPKNGALIDGSGQFLFDVERNWALVAAMLSDPKAKVQWIFLDTPLKYALIDYAIRTGATPERVEHAEKVIVRPNNSSPHANHFHVRIFCTARDLEYGCKDYGPEWGWVKKDRAAGEQRIQALVDRIMAGESELMPMDGAPIPPLPPIKAPRYERDNLPTEVEIER
jgi:penicillin-insensitive murein endopeptidase